MTIENLLSKETKIARAALSELLAKDMNALVGKCFIRTYLDEHDIEMLEYIKIERIEDGMLVGTLVEIENSSFSIDTECQVDFHDLDPISHKEFFKTLTLAQSMLDQKIQSLKESK